MSEDKTLEQQVTAWEKRMKERREREEAEAKAEAEKLRQDYQRRRTQSV